MRLMDGAVPGEVAVCRLPLDNMMLGSAHSRGQTPRAQQNGTAKEQQDTCGTLILIFINERGVAMVGDFC